MRRPILNPTHGGEVSFEEIGRELGMSAAGARHALTRALRKLQHPSRAELLRPYLRRTDRRSNNMGTYSHDQIYGE